MVCAESARAVRMEGRAVDLGSLATVIPAAVRVLSACKRREEGVVRAIGVALALFSLALPFDGKAARVVVVQTNAAAPYEAALGALSEALSPDVDVVVERVVEGDTKLAERIASAQPSAIVPLGTRATSWARENIEDVPIVFAMVLNPVSSRLVESMRRPAGRVTGASLDIPPGRQFQAIRDVIGAKRVAVLFNPDKTGKIVQEAVLAARDVGVELVPIQVADPTQIESSLDSVDDSFDALWSVADSTVLGRGAVKHVLLHTLDRRIPFVGLSEQYVRAGALLAMAASYEENGRQAAELVRRVLAGERTAAIAVATPRQVEVVFNPKTAERMRLAIDDRSIGLPLRPIR